MATTAVANSWKVEQMQAGHCFNATQTGVACSGTSGANTLTGLASTAGLAIGMGVSGTGIAAGAMIIGFPSATSVTLSANNTGTVTSATFTGDVFKGLLIKASPTLTYSGTQTNVGTPGTGTPSTSNVGTDEAPSGTGYTSGGITLGNITPSLPGNPTTTATTQFTPNPSWTFTAAFSCSALIVYNSTTRLGAAATPLNGRVVAVYDLGGTVSVSSGGTLTLLMPTNDGSNALIRAA